VESIEDVRGFLSREAMSDDGKKKTVT